MVKFKNVTFVFGESSLYGLLGTGILLAALATWGCYGASRQSACVLRTYSSILFVFLIAEIVFCVMILQFAGEVGGTGLSGGIQRAVNCTYTACCLNNSVSGCGIDPKSCGQLPEAFVQGMPRRIVEGVRSRRKLMVGEGDHPWQLCGHIRMRSTSPHYIPLVLPISVQHARGGRDGLLPSHWGKECRRRPWGHPESIRGEEVLLSRQIRRLKKRRHRGRQQAFRKYTQMG